MERSVLSFFWHRNSAGHEWRNARNVGMHGLEERALIARHEQGARNEVYDLDQTPPTVFREFVECSPTEDGVRKFADKWGLLWDSHASGADLLDASQSDDDHHLAGILGMTMHTWMLAQSRLKWAVALWDMLHRGDRHKLQSLIHWEDDAHSPDDQDSSKRPRAVVFRSGQSATEVIASRRIHAERLAEFKEPDVVWPARRFLCDLVTQGVASGASLALGVDPLDRFVRKVVPTSLLGLMWVQLLDTVSFKKDQYQCSVCGAWFEIQGFARKDKTYCSTKCRNRAYRGRQDRAVQLKAEGKTFRQIADELGSDLETVKGWIRGSNRKGK